MRASHVTNCAHGPPQRARSSQCAPRSVCRPLMKSVVAEMRSSAPAEAAKCAASADGWVPTWAPIEALVGALIAGTQRGFFPARLGLLVHRIGVT